MAHTPDPDLVVRWEKETAEEIDAAAMRTELQSIAAGMRQWIDSCQFGTISRLLPTARSATLSRAGREMGLVLHTNAGVWTATEIREHRKAFSVPKGARQTIEMHRRRVFIRWEVIP